MLKLYSVKRLNRISRKRELWCWGLGRRFHEMLEYYKDEPFLERITVLIDGRSDLWNEKMKIGDRSILVKSFRTVKEKWNKNVLLVITSDAYTEIYKSISTELFQKHIECCIYPQYYFTYTMAAMRFFRFLPLRRSLLFYAGSEPHENALAIVDYLQKEYGGKQYKILFMGEKKFDHARKLTGVDYLHPNTLCFKSSLADSIRYSFLYATSRFLLYENQPLKKVRKDQKLIYMNHGTIPLKNVRDVLCQPEEVDFCICPSPGCAEIYKEQYNLSRDKQIYCMPPRTVYINKCQNKIKRLLSEEKGEVILWLPTFRTLKGTCRRDSIADCSFPLLENEENIERLQKKLEQNRQFLWLKPHPREAERIHIRPQYSCIQLLTEEGLNTAGLVLQEIIGDTKALLTDYSGIAFEYLLLDKPIGYVISDMLDYRKGFAFQNPFDYMPGEKIKTIEELEGFFDCIKSGNDAWHAERLKLRERLFQGNDLQNGAKKLIDFLDNNFI